MAISSNTLFHFTDKYETLIQILESGGFWARYSKEYGWVKNFAVPVACFCDIPLTQIDEHTKTFGNYGIGLSKEWRESNKKICPVFYLVHNSAAFSVLTTFRKYSIQSIQDKKQLPEELLTANRRFFSLIKKYQGEGKDRKPKILYNEKEWRYIPDLSYKDSIIWESEFKDEEEYKKAIEESHLKTKGNLATFTPNDIKYLIIKEESERIELLKKIDEIYSNIYTANDLTLLKSKILTCTQIKEDF